MNHTRFSPANVVFASICRCAQNNDHMTRATDITTFDDLSSEIVLCIFDFLSPVDRYNAFFYCNSRLRSLVKRWTQYSRKGLDADIRRFSTLHSWYKHLRFKDGGTLSFILPRQGQEPRYNFDPRVTDAIGLHWHFISHVGVESIVDEKVRAIIGRHPFRLNPFFYHHEMKRSRSANESMESRLFYGGNIILSRSRFELKTWLESNYPDYVTRIFNGNDSNEMVRSDYDSTLVPIFDGEWSKAMSAIREAADRVWNELRDLDDVNPLSVR